MKTIFTLLSIIVLFSATSSAESIELARSTKAEALLSQLSEKAPTLNKKVLQHAINAYQEAANEGRVKKAVLTVIDYSLPSSQQRMWVFDLKTNKLVYNTHVAHGKNSGLDIPTHFSNKNSSKESSIGTYITKDTYIGSKGYSLNLEGLEKGYNDHAYSRRIVVHGAWYVDSNFIKGAGRAGRSWGCPALPKALAKPVINTIKGGSVLFAYYPDKNYLTHSKFV